MIPSGEYNRPVRPAHSRKESKPRAIKEEGKDIMKKIYSRILSMVLCLSMLLSMVVTTGASGDTNVSTLIEVTVTERTKTGATIHIKNNSGKR